MAAGAPDTINSMALGKHSMLRRLSSHYRALQFSPSLSLSLYSLSLAHSPQFPSLSPSRVNISRTALCSPSSAQCRRQEAKKRRKKEQKTIKSHLWLICLISANDALGLRSVFKQRWILLLSHAAAWGHLAVRCCIKPGLLKLCASVCGPGSTAHLSNTTLTL